MGVRSLRLTRKVQAVGAEGFDTFVSEGIASKKLKENLSFWTKPVKKKSMGI
jgi:hypothetical protein